MNSKAVRLLDDTMATFRPEAAQETHETEEYWDGNNHLNHHGGQFRTETLYLTATGRWIVVDKAAGPRGVSWAGSRDDCYEIAESDAAVWLIVNDNLDHPLAAAREV